MALYARRHHSSHSVLIPLLSRLKKKKNLPLFTPCSLLSRISIPPYICFISFLSFPHVKVNHVTIPQTRGNHQLALSH